MDLPGLVLMKFVGFPNCYVEIIVKFRSHLPGYGISQRGEKEHPERSRRVLFENCAITSVVNNIMFDTM